MSAMFLSTEDVTELTGKCRYKAQVRALAMMGVKYTVRPDGRPIVLKTALEAETIPAKEIEPDWSALN